MIFYGLRISPKMWPGLPKGLAKPRPSSSQGRPTNRFLVQIMVNQKGSYRKSKKSLRHATCDILRRVNAQAVRPKGKIKNAYISLHPVPPHHRQACCALQLELSTNASSYTLHMSATNACSIQSPPATFSISSAHRSLGLLCERFCSKFGLHSSTCLHHFPSALRANAPADYFRFLRLCKDNNLPCLVRTRCCQLCEATFGRN